MGDQRTLLTRIPPQVRAALPQPVREVSLVTDPKNGLFAWMIKNLCRRSGLDDASVVHQVKTAGNAASKGDVVRDQQHRLARLGKIVDHVQHLAGIARVECAGWFVQEKDPRFNRHGPGDGHALLLAAGKILGVVVNLVRQAHALEKCKRCRLDLAARSPQSQARTGQDVVQDTCGEEMNR